MTKEELLQKGKRKVRQFTLPDGEILYFRKASARAFELVNGITAGTGIDFQRMIRLLIECLCDENGNPMFGPENFDDIAALELDYLITVMRAMGETKVNGETPENVIKNFEASQTADLVSA